MRVAFVGLGAMGRPMARNLAKKFEVIAYDLSDRTQAKSVTEATKDVEVVVTALPAAKQVDAVVAEALLAVKKGTLFVDCSTVAPSFAKAVDERCRERGCRSIDAPMSGGVPGAEKATLTFMVGGDEDVVQRATPVLEAMGSKVKRAGPSGAGAAAKLCNNMILASQMIAVSEGLHLAEALGLDVGDVYDVLSTATAKSWALNEYPPVPNVGNKTSPANFDFTPGFAASLMRKDLDIAMAAAKDASAYVPLGRHALQLYTRMLDDDHFADLKDKDFSAIINLLRRESLSSSESP
mmetsp:Transcript_30596/g.98602  ORF Transcript_30596/g.98602 Transcript_30596/m.98602 type:complete len:294 (-) Transcript_30596:56-937(-)